MIGSPKSQQNKQQGEIHQCTKPDFVSGNPSCTSLPVPTEAAEASGLSVSVQDDQSILVSILRQRTPSSQKLIISSLGIFTVLSATLLYCK